MLKLITTPIEKTEIDQKNTLYLGPWCLPNLEILKNKSIGGINYHWDDRKKLQQDEIALKTIHDELLTLLANNLNELHQIDRPINYWKTILDPWLLSYVSVLWDRFESVKGIPNYI